METSTNLGRVSPVPRGEYDPAVQYERLDIVRYAGSGYLVLRPVQGVTPDDGADYMLLTQAGQDGVPGADGEDGSSIANIERTSGNGAPGTVDTYTVTLTDGSTSTFQVYNGKDGGGSGDMTKAIYDPQNKAQDIYKYVDDALKNVPTEENAVTVPGGGVMELGPELGEGPYTFELTEDGETAVSAAQVSYDGTQSGLQAETAQGAVDELGARIARMSGVSLVDNGYFADPINQLGKTEYAGGLTIDRFLTDGLTVTLEDGWLKLQNKTEAAHYFVQNKDPNQFKWIVKERVTQSLLYKDNTPGCAVYWGYSADGAEFTSAVYAILPDGEGEKLYCGTSNVLPGVTTVSQWQPFGLSVPPGGMCRLKAAKLELGPVQTLAHKEGNNWVLNDPPPDKALELLKCRRYFLQLPGEASAYTMVGRGKSSNANQLDLQFPVPVSMRANPSVSMTGNWIAVGAGAAIEFPSESMTVTLSSVGATEIGIVVQGFTNLAPNHVYTIQRNNDPTAKIIFDANLM